MRTTKSVNPFSIQLFLAALTGLFVCSSSSVRAQGNLLINPMRVVFEGSKRIEELSLANTGKDTARYVVSLIEIKMSEDGNFTVIDVPDSSQSIASPYLRVFPRSVTLAPNEGQVVKVQLINTNKLQGGEYRSHLYFRGVPSQKPLGEIQPKNDTSISVTLRPIFGISIPIIIHSGDCVAQTSISDISLNTKDTVSRLSLVFNRTGNISVYGDLTVTHISDNGKVTRVGYVRGIAVYTPNPKRSFKLLLDAKANINYHSGKLHLDYADHSPKPVTLAEGEIILN